MCTQDQTSHQFSCKSGKSSAKANRGSSLLKTQIASYMDFCSQNLWDDILAFAKYKYEVCFTDKMLCCVLPAHLYAVALVDVVCAARTCEKAN